jgi:hypothetical protein
VRHAESRPGHDWQRDLAPIDGTIAVVRQPCVAENRASVEHAGVRQRSAGALGRPLRDHGQRQRFGKTQLTGRLSEIDAACRGDALDVAAKRHQVEIRLEDLALGIPQFEPRGRGDLPELARCRPGVQAIRETGELHRNGRSPLAIAINVGLVGGAGERQWTKSRMPVGPPILFQQERIDQRGRDLGERHPQPELIVRRAGDAQQLAVGGPDGRGKRCSWGERRMRPGAQQHEADSRTCSGDGNPPDPDSCPHGLITSSVPARLSPVTVRLYIPSANAGGV